MGIFTVSVTQIPVDDNMLADVLSHGQVTRFKELAPCMADHVPMLLLDDWASLWMCLHFQLLSCNLQDLQLSWQVGGSGDHLCIPMWLA